MKQYQNDKSKKQSADPITADDIAVDRKIAAIRAHVEKQDAQIKDLEKEIKKIKNEVRLAVNAYNLKHGK